MAHGSSDFLRSQFLLLSKLELPVQCSFIWWRVTVSFNLALVRSFSLIAKYWRIAGIKKDTKKSTKKCLKKWEKTEAEHPFLLPTQEQTGKIGAMGRFGDKTRFCSGTSQEYCSHSLPFPFWNRLKQRRGGPLAHGAPSAPLCSASLGLLWDLVQHQNRSGIRPQDEHWSTSSCKEIRASWGPFAPISWDCLEHTRSFWDL